jgi:hypothetical protein
VARRRGPPDCAAAQCVTQQRNRLAVRYCASRLWADPAGAAESCYLKERCIEHDDLRRVLPNVARHAELIEEPIISRRPPARTAQRTTSERTRQSTHELVGLSARPHVHAGQRVHPPSGRVPVRKCECAQSPAASAAAGGCGLKSMKALRRSAIGYSKAFTVEELNSAWEAVGRTALAGAASQSQRTLA